MSCQESGIIREIHDLGLSADEYDRLLDAMASAHYSERGVDQAEGPFAMPAAA